MAIVNGSCTLPQLKARLNIGDNRDDATLEALVTAVSRQIEDYTGHRFYATTATRVYTAVSPTCLLLPRGHDLLSVTTLKTDEDGDRTYEVTWDADDYDLRPSNAPSDGLPYWQLHTRWLGEHYLPTNVPLGVEIAGTWGYSSSTPAVVQEACLLQCQMAFQQGLASGSPAAGTGEYAQTLIGVGLHPFCRRMLDPYRDLVMA